MARPATSTSRLLAGSREPCRVATTANINPAAGGLLTIDGVTVEPSDRVLVKDQSDQKLNGIYGASAGEWYRASDARSPRAIDKGVTVHVQEGTANAGKVYAFQTLDPVIGTDDIQISFYISDDIVAGAEDDIQQAVDEATAAMEAASEAMQEAAAAAEADIDQAAAEALEDIAEGGQEQLDAIAAAGGAITGIVSPIIIAENTFGTKGSVELWNPETPPDYVRTAGHWTAGDGGGALYKKVGAEPAHGGKIHGADGTWWSICPGPVNVKQFGAWGNGIADDTAAIQAAIDFQMYFGSEDTVYLPGGSYKTTDTIHLGYGDDFKSVSVRGAGYKFRNYGGAQSYAGVNGTSINPTQTDRPVFAVQGGRGTMIRDLSFFYEPYYTFISERGMGSASGPLLGVDDTIVDNWNFTSMSPTQDSRHAPFAAIAIDPYSGSRKTAKTITAITNASPGVVTSTAHGFVTNEVVLLTVAGMTELNGNYYRVALINTNSYSLKHWATGVAIDTTSFGTFTSGTAISPSYPNVNYPTWLPVDKQTQYGKNFSQQTLIENVHFSGFTVAVVMQPCDADGNGDYTVLRRCYIEEVKWGLSAGNTQNRNVGLYDNLHARSYCCLTSNKHGRQSGKFGGSISNMSVAGGSINIFEFGSVYPQPIVFTNFYAEGLYKIGDVQSTGSIERPYIFDGGEFNFSHDGHPERGFPNSILTGQLTQTTPFIFRGCEFAGYRSVVSFMQPGMSFEMCLFRSGTLTQEYEKFAHNLLAGGCVPYRMVTPNRARLKFTPYNLSTFVLHTATMDTAVANSCGRNFCVPMHCERVQASSEPVDRMVPPQVAVTGFSKSTFASSTLVGRVLTFTFASRTDALFLQQGPLPGDVLWDNDTGSVFFVSARTALVVTAILQNNYKNTTSSSGVFSDYIVPYSPLTGTLYFRPSRVYTPMFYLRGDLTTSVANITNCARDDNNAAWYDAEISVGDQLLVSGTTDAYTNYTAATITARSQAAGTITITATGSTRTQVRRRLDYFIRTPPANV